MHSCRGLLLRSRQFLCGGRDLPSRQLLRWWRGGGLNVLLLQCQLVVRGWRLRRDRLQVLRLDLLCVRHARLLNHLVRALPDRHGHHGLCGQLGHAEHVRVRRGLRVERDEHGLRRLRGRQLLHGRRGRARGLCVQQVVRGRRRRHDGLQVLRLDLLRGFRHAWHLDHHVRAVPDHSRGRLRRQHCWRDHVRVRHGLHVERGDHVLRAHVLHRRQRAGLGRRVRVQSGLLCGRRRGQGRGLRRLHGHPGLLLPGRRLLRGGRAMPGRQQLRRRRCPTRRVHQRCCGLALPGRRLLHERLGLPGRQPLRRRHCRSRDMHLRQRQLVVRGRRLLLR